jgi:hypothetical protein
MTPTPCGTGRWRLSPAFVLLLTLGTSPAGAQGFGYMGMPNYNWGGGGPSYLNYNYSFSRYGLPGVGISPYDPIMQAQLNIGTRTAMYDMYNAWSAEAYQAANLYNQQAIAQSLANGRQMQAMQPRYDVRKRTPRSTQAADRVEPQSALPRSELLAADGKVIWPANAPKEGELGKARSAAEAAIAVALKEYKANGKATVQSVVEAKELLYDYGRPVLEKAAARSRTNAQKLLRFFASLEQTIDSLAGA